MFSFILFKIESYLVLSRLWKNFRDRESYDAGGGRRSWYVEYVTTLMEWRHHAIHMCT